MADHFDLACSALMTWLKFGLTSPDQSSKMALDRLRPLENALLKATSQFRSKIRDRPLVNTDSARFAAAKLLNRDFNRWSGDVTTWSFAFNNHDKPPASFAVFPEPPVPEFEGVASFASASSEFVDLYAPVRQRRNDARRSRTGNAAFEGCCL